MARRVVDQRVCVVIWDARAILCCACVCECVCARTEFNLLVALDVSLCASRGVCVRANGMSILSVPMVMLARMASVVSRVRCHVMCLCAGRTASRCPRCKYIL